MSTATRSINALPWTSADSEAAVGERYQKGATPHTIFAWWARRPFSAVEAVLRTVLPPVGGSRTGRVLDVFAGGGTIPLAVAQGGSYSYAVESNELAQFELIALLKLSQATTELPELVRAHGTNLLARLEAETSVFFPSRGNESELPTVAYFWSRSLRCPQCDGQLSLQKRPWLARKSGRQVYIQRRQCGDARYEVALQTGTECGKSETAWDGREIVCPFCGHRVTRAAMADTLERWGFDELTASCRLVGGRKTYEAADLDDSLLADAAVRDGLAADLAALGASLPDVSLPRWSGIVNPPLYGTRTVADLFNARQLAVMVRLCRCLREEYEQCLDTHGVLVAQAVAAFLSGLVDQLADWNSRLAMWIPQNEQVGRGLSGPGIPMMWDYVESDPLTNGPSNLWAKLRRIEAGLHSIATFPNAATVVRGDARSLPFDDDTFDAVITDPPYFDNLFYSVLADCIYPWKRLALKTAFPDLFHPDRTNAEDELTAARYRQGSVDAATTFYTDGLRDALAESRRVVKPGGRVVVFFAHSSIDAWTSVLSAMLGAKLEVTHAVDAFMERKHRPRGVRSASVECSLVLVAQPRSGPSRPVSWSSFEIALHDYIAAVTAVADHQSLGHRAFGGALCLASAAPEIRDGSEALSPRDVVHRLADAVSTVVPGFKLVRR